MHRQFLRADSMPLPSSGRPGLRQGIGNDRKHIRLEAGNDAFLLRSRDHQQLRNVDLGRNGELCYLHCRPDAGAIINLAGA
jgi:hypothetical protein